MANASRKRCPLLQALPSPHSESPVHAGGAVWVAAAPDAAAVARAAGGEGQRAKRVDRPVACRWLTERELPRPEQPTRMSVDRGAGPWRALRGVSRRGARPLRGADVGPHPGARRAENLEIARIAEHPVGQFGEAPNPHPEHGLSAPRPEDLLRGVDHPLGEAALGFGGLDLELDFPLGRISHDAEDAFEVALG